MHVHIEGLVWYPAKKKYTGLIIETNTGNIVGMGELLKWDIDCWDWRLADIAMHLEAVDKTFTHKIDNALIDMLAASFIAIPTFLTKEDAQAGMIKWFKDEVIKPRSSWSVWVKRASMLLNNLKRSFSADNTP